MKTSRAYSYSSQDLRSMIALLNIVRPLDQLTDYPSNVNLHELLQSAALRANTRLWFDDEQIIAFGLVDEYDNLLFDCPPDQLDILGNEVIEWGLSRLDKKARSLDAACRESDTTRITFLEMHGFARIPTETISMRRDLMEPIPEPILPTGFTIRSVKGADEAEALAELHRAAFGTDHVTTAERLKWMRVPEYDPGLDLVVIAPNGIHAAYCMCSISNEQNRITGRLEGQTDPVGTHPGYQKLGLARALLLSGLGLLKKRGMKTAGLGTSSDNIAMQKAAQSVGYCVRYKKLWFEKATK